MAQRFFRLAAARQKTDTQEDIVFFVKIRMFFWMLMKRNVFWENWYQDILSENDTQESPPGNR